MASDKTTKAVTVANPGAVIPAYIQQGDRRGQEQMTRDDIRMPRLTIAQGLSKQVIESEAVYIEGLKVGHAFNDLTNEIYGKGPLRIVVVRADPPRWVEFDENRQVIDPSVKPGDSRTLFRTNSQTGKREPPIATQFYDYVLLLGPEKEPIAMSMKGTAIREAKRLNGLIKAKPVPIFACYYDLSVTEQKNKQGVWYIFSVHQAGFVDADTYSYAEQAFEATKEKTIPFDREREPGEDDDAPEV